MIKGYDDSGKRVKIVHWPLKSLNCCRFGRRPLNNRREDGKVAPGYAGVRWPYSQFSANGYNPWTGKSR